MVGWTFTKLAICSVDFDGVSPGPTKSTENTQGLKTIDFVTAFLYIYNQRKKPQFDFKPEHEEEFEFSQKPKVINIFTKLVDGQGHALQYAQTSTLH